MSDFLHNLRSGNVKRYDKSRKPYDRPGYHGQERGNVRERKNYSPRRGPDVELMGAIRKLLEGLVETQRQMAEIEERRTAAEERKSRALERLAEHFCRLESGPAPFKSPAQAIPSPASRADRERIGEMIAEKRREGMSYERIAQHLENEGVPTFSGRGQWRGQTVHRIWKKI
jgi:hypothetical protein